MKPSAPLVLFATGSSGGHVTPALSVAEALEDAGEGVRIVFAGPAAGVAERMAAVGGRGFLRLEVAPLRGAGRLRWARGIADLPAGAARSIRILRKFRPDLVVGTGNHTSGPLLALAAAAEIPTLVLEANVKAGLANRLLRPVVRGAAVAWRQTMVEFPGRGFHAGCPVGRRIRDASSRDADRTNGRFHLLVLGGSAGSPALDRAMREALPHLGTLPRSLAVTHQAAPGEVDSLREHYRRAGVEARVEPFFPDLSEHYLRAHLVVTRPGGVTLAELAAVGRPAIVVPLPSAGDHQRANAAAWEAAGCARSVLPEQLDGRTLAASILSLVDDPDTLMQMGEAARAHALPDAARHVADWCLHAVRTG